MDELNRTFGRLLAVHRRRVSYTQHQLADRAGLSVDMISKMEVGATGASFTTISKLARVLKVDPADFFALSKEGSGVLKGPLLEVTTTLAALSEGDLLWIKQIIEAALKPR